VETLLSNLLSSYGPLALGWIVASFLAWRVLSESASNRISSKDVLDDYHELLRAYHLAMVENTKVTERLAMLIEERTKRQVRNAH
jgi:hypothetical protein